MKTEKETQYAVIIWLANLYFICFLLYVEELSFYFQFFFF